MTTLLDSLDKRKNIAVQLHPGEIERARAIAEIRNSKNGFVVNRRETKRHSDFDIHYAGARAEVALSRILHTSIDETFLMGGDDHSPDLFIGEKSIEVKTALYYPPIFKVNRLSDIQSDAIVLCYASLRNPSLIEIHGGLPTEVFQQKAGIQTFILGSFNNGQRHCVDSTDMWPLHKLAEWALQPEIPTTAKLTLANPA